ncbi:heterokaryon incompatibility protein-domain-containing protein, partial [Cladorrhinum sp. PSN332]
MSRWHHSSCPFPAVVIGIRDGIPQCHTCQAVPDLAKLAAEVAGYSALPPIPPGEPLHDLGLFWPGTVQYTIHPRSDANSPKERSTKFDDAPDPFPAHAIYEPLPPNSFRILWLGPSANVDDPIHIDLCVFGFDDRPDYETTSYTWGGEDGNDTFCRPIFIGPHWDVLYQTDNCWSMLKFLRPPRGERALWIDAICINQRDTMEREDQVSQMSLIYQQASRLNVFLGSDMITPLPENRAYPPRRPISSLQSELLQNTTSVSLVDLLNRRFFTRLWVVQELTISKQSFMRVGITEYRIDKATMGQVAKEVWNSSPAPWFQQASKGLLKGLKGSSSLLNAVIGAWKCSCSDPRDLIFGVLSIVKESAIVRGEWAEMESHMQPNYAISTQHAFIGMFAHCLAVDRDPRVLMAASGVSGWDKYPSWIPAWESPGPLISVEVDLNYQLYVEWTSEWQHKVLKRCQVTNNIDSRLEGCSNCGLEDVYMRFMEVGGHENIAKTLAYTPVTVMASTGSVLVNLAHFFRINMRPAVVDQMEGTSVLCYHLSATMLNTSDANAEKFDPDEHQIFFTSKTKGLERLICPEKDHLFYLSTGDRRPLFLLLRQTDTPGVFRLVARCLQVFF